MIKLRSLHLERTIEQQLPGSGLQQVLPAYDFGDIHCVVVSHNRKLVRGNVVSAPDDEVSEIAAGDMALRPKMLVVEPNLLAVGDSKPPVHSRGSCKAQGIPAAAAFPRINRLVIRTIRCARRLRQLLPRACARINKSAVSKLLPCRQMMTQQVHVIL